MRLLLIVLLLLTPLAAQAADRIALVVGMADYQTVVKLDNTANDARGISTALEKIGFQVTTLIDSTGNELRAAVEEFSFRSETADLALIYFAGHGVEVQGENFLIPVDADIKSNRDVQRQAISLKELLAAVDHARKMRIVILDSCRDNPFGDALDIAALEQTAQAAEATRSAGSGGLAAPSPDRGTLVAFAARDGEKALDGGKGGNSPFAQALMKNLPQPGLEISLMFRQVRDDVLAATYNRQEPHTYGSLPGTPFYVAGTAGTAIDSEQPSVAWSGLSPEQETRIAALAEEGNTRSMLSLAYMRLDKRGARFDPQTAAQLLARAADAGDPEAMHQLARLYETGDGVPQDPARALELYQLSAAQEYPDALNDLGVLYFQGELGLARDEPKALDYFERAAALRQKQAMYNFASMIDDGRIPGKGPADAADLLYQSLRAGSRGVLDQMISNSRAFKPETRKALQAKLADKGFYSGPVDGDFGPGTQRAIAAAFGLTD